MEYSSQEGKIVIPEYGRNVQRMVEYALTLDDRQERERCVEAIMQTMCNLFPYLKDEAQRHKMYDHLAIMSDFRLDIDFPYERPLRDEMRYQPKALSYPENPIKMRQYGRIVELMIDSAIEQTDTAHKNELIVRIANRMKRNYLLYNKDQVDDEVIVDDIRRLSNGRLNCDFPEFQLASAKVLLGQKDDNTKSAAKTKTKKNKNKK